MRFIKHLLSCFILLCFINILNHPLYAEETYKLLVFGDSLTSNYGLNKNESFPTQLQEALIDEDYTQVTILNESKSGETTKGGLNRIHNALKTNPNGILIELGINDVIRGESISTIKNNLSQLIEICQQKNIAVLLIGMKAPPITEPYYAQQFENIYTELGKKYNVLVYPFFIKGIFGGNKYKIIAATRFLQSDKAHPTKQGVTRIVEDIMPTIEKFLNQQGIKPQ